MTSLLVLAAAGMIAAAAPMTAQAAPAMEQIGLSAPAASDIIPVAEGCGPGRWRGPWGGCRGPGPGSWYAPPPVVYEGGNSCPPGFWRGPWGHCRDTPYHGRLPDGGWR